MSQEHPDDLQIRILALLDGALDQEEVTRLDAELRDSREARQLYQQLATLHSSLEDQGLSQSDLDCAPVIPIDLLVSRQRQRVVKISLLAAAALMLISAVVFWMTQIPHSPASLADFQAAPNSVFTLTHTGDGVNPRGNVLAEGSSVVIEHGAVELNLPHEVLAIIEAPAAITLVDARTLQLDHGRAFFQVSSEEGKGFTVITPHQQIVDLGTAFGVDSRLDSDEVELHVFEGRVRVDDLDGGAGEVIKAKRSVSLAGTQIKHDLDGPPAAFRRILPTKVETLLREDFESGLVGDRDYAVQIDPTAIRDLAGNRFHGIDDDTTWNFTTVPPAAAQTSTGPLVITPTAGMATSQFGDWLDTIDGTGLSSGGTSGDILSETHAAGGGGNFALIPGGPDFTGESVTFTVPAPATVNQVHLWLDHSVWGDITGFDLEFSTDGGSTFPTVVTGITFDGAAADLAVVQTRTFAEQIGVTHIRLSNVVVTGGDQAYAGFNEIRFGGPTEPDATPPSVPVSATVRPRGDGLDDLIEKLPAPDKLRGLTERDESPPQLMALHPADNATYAMPGGRLAMVFNEPVKLGAGRFFIWNLSGWSETTLTVGDPRISVDGRVLSITPSADLADGERRIGAIAGWEVGATVAFLNPRGDGTWYADDDLQDKGRGRGTIGSMRGALMASIGPGAGIRRQFATIAPDSRYTVSAAIGVRDGKARENATFPGYTIRLVSGDTILAELSDDTPPGPPNSVTSVGLSWDSSTLPEGLAPGAPLAIEIAPNKAADLDPGYLDLDNVRVTVVGE